MKSLFDYLGTAPEEAGVAVLAPNSRDNTWDAIGGSFGPDVKFLNRALERVFEMLAIDATWVTRSADFTLLSPLRGLCIALERFEDSVVQLHYRVPKSS